MTQKKDPEIKGEQFAGYYIADGAFLMRYKGETYIGTMTSVMEAAFELRNETEIEQARKILYPEDG